MGPRNENVVADNLSRCFDCDEWGIQWWSFKALDDKWRPHTFNRFASAHNWKCDKFNTKFWCKENSDTDGMSQTWTGENNWVVPPPSIIPGVVSKITKRTCKCYICYAVLEIRAILAFNLEKCQFVKLSTLLHCELDFCRLWFIYRNPFEVTDWWRSSG